MARARKIGNPKRNRRNWLARTKQIEKNNEILKQISEKLKCYE